MRRAEVIAKGDVQRVGYRDAVQRIARNLGITGSVQNVGPYDVRIIAEGDEEYLKQFIEAIRIDRHPIHAKELEIEWVSATGEFEYFIIIRGDWQEELGERFDVAAGLLYRSVELGEENIAIGRKMLDKQDIMIEKQDKMLGKQDQMIDKQDTMIKKQDKMIDKQDVMIDEVRGVRYDLKSYMESRFERIEGEISEIKKVLKQRGLS